MVKYFLILFFPFFLFLSCNDNPVEEISNNDFMLEVKVVDQNGSPVPGINVSMWNKSQVSQLTEKQGKINSATQIEYSIMDPSFVNIVLYDLNDRIKEKLISQMHSPGLYSFMLMINENAGTTVYKCKLTASADSLNQNIVFQDSIFIVLWQPDPVVSAAGKTNSQGTITISNKLLFPHLLGLPAIPRTIEGGPQIIGDIIFSDTVVIALSDEFFFKTIHYDRKILNKKNNFTLVWNENLLKSEVIDLPSEGSIPLTGLNIKTGKEMIFEWKLFQNYPNPFN